MALRADGYLHGWLYLAARFALDYQTWRPNLNGLQIGGFSNTQPITPAQAAQLDSNELALHAEVAVGHRWQTAQLAVGWGVRPYRPAPSGFQVRFWGGAFASARAVVRRFVDLTARVEVLDHGATVAAVATVWLRRRFGLTVGADGGHGASFDASTPRDRAGGRVGVACWLTPGLAASLAYAPAWQSGMPVAGIGATLGGISSVSHLLTLTVAARPQLLR